MKMEGIKGRFEKTGGLFYFARMCAKIRLHAGGRLPNDYHEMLGQGFDRQTCRYLRVRCEDVRRLSRIHMKTTLLLICSMGFCLSLHAGWIIDPNSRIVYSRKQAEGYPNFDEALKELFDNGRIEKLDGIVAYQLLGEDALQDEIFATLERDAPQKLAAALKSAGNMHNPKVLQLWSSFQKALLATSTITQINTSLMKYGLAITRVGVEKFELRSTPTDSRRRFHGLLWLYVTK